MTGAGKALSNGSTGFYELKIINNLQPDIWRNDDLFWVDVNSLEIQLWIFSRVNTNFSKIVFYFAFLMLVLSEEGAKLDWHIVIQLCNYKESTKEQEGCCCCQWPNSGRGKFKCFLIRTMHSRSGQCSPPLEARQGALIKSLELILQSQAQGTHCTQQLSHHVSWEYDATQNRTELPLTARKETLHNTQHLMKMAFPCMRQKLWIILQSTNPKQEGVWTEMWLLPKEEHGAEYSLILPESVSKRLRVLRFSHNSS